MSVAVDGPGLLLALRRVGSLVLFGVLPVLAVGLVMGWTVRGPSFVSDFHGDLYDAGRAILAGDDPYRPAYLDQLAAAARLGRPIPAFAVPVYPAPALLAGVPLALLPFRAAGLLFTAVSVLALCGGLRLLGVRDRRCYGAAFLSWPVLHSLRLGQVNELLVLGAALAWRLRERPVGGGAALGATIVLKVLLWPLGLFGAITRRSRLSLSAAAWAVGLVLGGWGLIGFVGLLGYPHLLGSLSTIEGTSGVSLLAAAHAAGLPTLVGRVAEVLVTGGLVAAAVAVRRRGACAGVRDDARVFGLLVVAGLSSTSVAWPHYATLLFVPIALLAPTLSPLWLLPLLCDLAPVERTNGSLAQISVYLVVELGVALALCRPLVFRRAAEGTGGDVENPAVSGPSGSGPTGHPLDCCMASDRPHFAHTSRRSGRPKRPAAPTRLGRTPEPRQQPTDHP